LAIIGWRGCQGPKYQAIFDETMKEFLVAPYPDGAGGDIERISRVVSGGAKGADTMAEAWACKHRRPMTVLKPAWRTKNEDGTMTYNPRAGLDRNTDIVAAATHVVAFPR
jgi:hypothetical protein